MTGNAANADRLMLLIESIFDDRASKADISELNSMLLGDAAARNRFVKYCQMHVTLRVELRASRAVLKAHREIESGAFSLACDTHAVSVEAHHPGAAAQFIPALTENVAGSFASIGLVAYLLATVIVGIGLAIMAVVPASQLTRVATHTAPNTVRRSAVVVRNETVGTITAMVGCKWDGQKVDPLINDQVPINQKYVLAAGLMEITYNTGAKVLVQGPAIYEVDATNGGRLALGKLTGKVENAVARGFVVSTPTATVTDLGTEFGVEVHPSGATFTNVFRGSVEVLTVANTAGKTEAIRLKADESANVERSGDGCTICRVAGNPGVFIRDIQPSGLNHSRQLETLHRWQTYVDNLRADPAMVVFYDFQRHTDSPSILHANASESSSVLDGILESVLSVSDANLLRGKSVTASSQFKNDVPPPHVTDGTINAFAFRDDDTVRAISISGIHSNINKIRIWRGADRIPGSVSVYGSTKDNGGSLRVGDYVPLASLASIPWKPDGHVDIAVKAPGMRSLLFKLGITTDGGLMGSEIGEIQAFAEDSPLPDAAMMASWGEGLMPGKNALPLGGNVTVRSALPQRLTQITLAAWITIERIDDATTACSLLASDGAADETIASPKITNWFLTREGSIGFDGPHCRFRTPSVLPWQTWNRKHWRHLALIVDPTKQRMVCYLDGKEVGIGEVPKDFSVRFGHITNWRRATASRRWHPEPLWSVWRIDHPQSSHDRKRNQKNVRGGKEITRCRHQRRVCRVGAAK